MESFGCMKKGESFSLASEGVDLCVPIDCDEAYFHSTYKLVVYIVNGGDRKRRLGVIFDLDGTEVGELGYPARGRMPVGVDISYIWMTHIDNGFKIFFGTNTMAYRDFWCDFDLGTMSYVTSGEAR